MIFTPTRLTIIVISKYIVIYRYFTIIELEYQLLLLDRCLYFSICIMVKKWMKSPPSTNSWQFILSTCKSDTIPVILFYMKSLRWYMIWTNRVVVINTNVEGTSRKENPCKRGRKICSKSQSVSYIRSVRHMFPMYVDVRYRLYQIMSQNSQSWGLFKIAICISKMSS